MNQESALKLAQTIADFHFYGHLTILRFTTGWKAMFGTPEMLATVIEENTGYKVPEGYVQIQNLPQFKTLEEALLNLVADWSLTPYDGMTL